MSILEDVKEVITGTDNLLTEVYKDGLSKSVQAAGNIVALPLEAIDAALSEAKLWVAERQYNFEKTKKLLAQKFDGVDPKDIVPPENYVAVPALQQISYCFDSNELRNMYANLLASSMKIQTKWEVHPAFVDIIKQLTPDEAKLLKILQGSSDDIFPVLEIMEKSSDGELVLILSGYTDIGESILESPQNICAYIDNLERLKLIEIDMSKRVFDDSVYEHIKQTDYVKDMIKRGNFTNENLIFVKGHFHVTAFGGQFIKVCI